MTYFPRLFTYIRAIFGNPSSQYEIGKILLNHADPSAITSGETWLFRAAENNHKNACLTLATHHIHRKQLDKAISVLELPTQADNIDALALLGQLYLNLYTDILDRQKFTENEISHCEIEQVADDLGIYISQLVKDSVADISCSDAKQVNFYKTQAIHYLDLAKSHHHPLALHAKAIYILEYTSPLEAQQCLAVEHLELAANKGFSPSMQVLAGFYENGLYGVKKDISRGLNLRISAAQTGSKEAQFSLGCLVYTGHGFEQHKVKGLELIKLAANKGHIQAKEYLSKIQIETQLQ